MNAKRDIPPIQPAKPYQGCNVAAVSDVGPVREENQDFMGYFRFPLGQLLVVADGMGGHTGGFQASRIVVNALRQSAADHADDDPSTILRVGIEEADRLVKLAATSDPTLQGMGSTVVAAYVRDGRAWFAHVGDSRAYLVRRGEVRRLTRDHTRVNRMIEAGMLTPEQAETHPMSHVLERSVGASASVEPEVCTEPVQLAPGDRLVLTSDGVTGRVEDGELGSMATQGDLRSAVERILHLALERHTDDNSTVGALEFHGGDESGVALEFGAPRLEVPPPPPTSPWRWALLGGVVAVALCGLIALWVSSGAKPTEPAPRPEATARPAEQAPAGVIVDPAERDASMAERKKAPEPTAAPAPAAPTETPQPEAANPPPSEPTPLEGEIDLPPATAGNHKRKRHRDKRGATNKSSD